MGACIRTKYRGTESVKSRKQAFQLFKGGLAAILGKFKSFCMPYTTSLLFAVELDQKITELIGNLYIAIQEVIQAETHSFLLFIRNFLSTTIGPGVYIGKLGRHLLQSSSLLINDMINTHHNIGLKRMRLLKCIAVIEDNRASGKRQCIRGEEFCLYQNNRIIHQDTTISVIGVISVRPVHHNNVGLPIPYLPDHFFPVFKCRHQFTIMDIKYVCCDSQYIGSILDLLHSAKSEFSARHPKVTDIPVGHRDAFECMSLGSPHRSNSARGDFAIIWMGAKSNNSKNPIFGLTRVRLFSQQHKAKGQDSKEEYQFVGHGCDVWLVS